MFSLPDPRNLLIYGCGAAVVVLLGLVGLQTLRVGWAQVEAASVRAALATEKQDRADERAVREETARRAEARNAMLQAQHAAETVRNADAIAAERADADRRVADADRERDELRLATEAARTAARDHRAGADAVTCRPRGDHTDTAWNLFGEADSLAQTLARDAEREAARARALKRQLDADRMACSGVDRGGNNGEAER